MDFAIAVAARTAIENTTITVRKAANAARVEAKPNLDQKDADVRAAETTLKTAQAEAEALTGDWENYGVYSRDLHEAHLQLNEARARLKAAKISREIARLQRALTTAESEATAWENAYDDLWDEPTPWDD
jgi:predicted  nucleic acid-binding Zn-ribbon protein